MSFKFGALLIAAGCLFSLSFKALPPLTASTVFNLSNGEPMNKTVHPLGYDLMGKKNSRYEIPTPALILDLDVLEKNMAIATQRANDKHIHLRPHSKSHKSISIAKLQMAAGAVGISCATLGEAEMMASAGIPGILITSPIVPMSKIERLIVLNQKSENLMVVVDHVQNIETLARANENNDKPLKVLIDFDIGQQRTGAKTIEEAMTLVNAINQTPSLTLVGIQAYGGHFQHIEDYSTRQQMMRIQNRIIQELSAQIQAHVSTPLIITGGGTGTFDIDLQESVYTELQIGSYIFMDVEYQAVELTKENDTPFSPSLFVLSSVVSTNPLFAVVDAGLKSFATDGPRPTLFSKTSFPASYQFMGDEHGKVTVSEQGHSFPLGHVLEFIVPHCDPTVNLYDFYHCVRGDALVDIWPVDARGLH